MSMMCGSKLGLSVGVLAGALVMATVGFATAGEKKGSEWELKTTMEMPGMPFAMPPTVIRQCLEDKAVPYQGKKDEKCEVKSQSVSGNTVTWDVVCDSKDGKMEMTGESSYTGDTMETKMKMKSKHGDMSMHMTGKKLGACK